MLAPPTGVSLADYIAALKNDNLTHARITFTNSGVTLTDENIEASGLTISSILNGDENMTIGRAVMSSLNVTFIKSDALNTIRWNDEVNVEIGIEIGGSTYWTSMGLFTGTKRYAMATYGILQYTANDRMQKFDTVASSWLATLTFPMTFREMYHSMCIYVGVPYRDGDELQNIMDRSFSSMPTFEEGITFRAILAFMAEACGCYAKITPDGYCQMVWYQDHANDYSIDGNDEYSLQYFDLTGGYRWEQLEDKTWEELEPYTWGDLGGYRDMFCVDCLICNFTDPPSSVQYPEYMNGNVYVITDNPFLRTSTDTEKRLYINSIYARLAGFSGYLPINMVCVGNPLLETGDIVTVEVEGANVAIPVFQRTFVWNGSVTDSIDVGGTVQRNTL